MLSREIPDAYFTIAFGIFPSSWNITMKSTEEKRKENEKQRRKKKMKRTMREKEMKIKL